MRYLTAGESHGAALIALLEGLPAGVRVNTADIDTALARRRLGYGRGARMKLERDAVRIVSGVWQGNTTGAPIAIEVANTEWPKWQVAMSPDPVAADVLATAPGTAPLTRPRPGHADLAGMQKYDYLDARPILERASARETAAKVAIGVAAKQFLAQAYGVTVLSHVVAIGGVGSVETELPKAADLHRIDADPVRCADAPASARMVAAIDEAKAAGDTLGGVVEVVVWGCPPGIGSHVQSDRRLDAQLAGALMGIPAIKGVAIGAGFAAATTPGSELHDRMLPGVGGITRESNNAGGIEGGISNGQPIWLRIAMKPIPTLANSLPTVDVSTGAAASAHPQRSDVCAVPAAGVVAEAVTALVIAGACLDKFGGDTVSETRRNFLGFLAQVREHGLQVL
ncbi:MAG: chorismate synthase [Propionibacteriaceae bacterium]|nr:chorismate synthase [Propionibacteriaceae bacterium]